MKTALQELINEMKDYSYKVSKEGNLDMVAAFDYAIGIAKKYKEKEKEQMLNFYMWMRMNESAEQYFHYTDEDMFAEYLKQISYDN
jgi:Cu2+-containing amine oxidase